MSTSPSASATGLPCPEVRLTPTGRGALAASFRLAAFSRQIRGLEVPDEKSASRGKRRSGRAAHIGFAAADHALRRGLGVRLGGGRAGAIFKVGQFSRFAPSEP